MQAYFPCNLQLAHVGATENGQAQEPAGLRTAGGYQQAFEAHLSTQETPWDQHCASTSPLLHLQGPPGTGKTRSLLAYIELMVTNKPLRPITPLLACTDTNAAVDNLVEGMVARNIKVVRIGHPAKVSIYLCRMQILPQL